MPPKIPFLHFPFYGIHPMTFGFAALPNDLELKQKFNQWGIVGHHGVDFGLDESTPILAADKGVVMQVGSNGDFGLSVTIKHIWGESLYAHLKEIKVVKDQSLEVGEQLGLSGQSGAAFGPHLHFGIIPVSPNLQNGYLGFIDPAPYLRRKTIKKIHETLSPRR